MKKFKKTKNLGIILFIILLSFTLIFIVQKKKTFSEEENRYLEKFPVFTFESFINGEYASDLQSYLCDQFPFRNLFVNLKTKVERMLGKKEINNVYFSADGYLIEGYKKPTNSDSIISILNRFYKSKNYVNMNLMLVPNSTLILNDKLPSNAFTYDQEKELNYIYDNIKFDTIDLIEPLKEASQEYQVFYKLDHHWTSYGAYFAYLEYAKMNDIEPLSMKDFEIEEVSNNFKGTLYSKVCDYTLRPDKMHVFIPKNTNYLVNYVMEGKKTNTLYENSYLNKKDKYSYFLDNNHPLIVITNNDIKSDKELLVIKDSYANSLVPFLVNHFSKVHVIDPRFYKQSIEKYLEENQNIKDVLFVYNMNTIDQDTGIRTIH